MKILAGKWKNVALPILFFLIAEPVVATPVYRATFEGPHYEIGDTYDSHNPGGSTLFVDPSGTSGGALTGITGSVASTWTAKVESGTASGNRLVFTQGLTDTLSGSVVFKAPPQGTAGQSGWWYVEMDYTRLTSTNGVIGAARPINQSGQQLIAHPHNVTLWTNYFEGATLNQNTTYRLRIEVEMGGHHVRTYVNGVLLHDHDGLAESVWDVVNVGPGFGGLSLNFGITAHVYGAGDRIFALDNIEIGTVDAPSAAPKVTFDPPNYVTGNSYNSASPGGSTLHVAPSGTSGVAITGLANTGSSKWTATVQSGSVSGNRLVISQNTNGAMGGGKIKFKAPQGTPGQLGRWFVQMDYTRLTSQGGVIGAMRPINQSEDNLIGHSYNVVLNTNSFDGVTLDQNKTYTLRIEVEMQGAHVRTYVDGILRNVYSGSDPNWEVVNDTGGATFSGMLLDFGIWSSSFNSGALFAIDNVQTGTVAPDHSSHPRGAYVLKLADKSQLQTALNTYPRVVLEKGDYASGGPASITLPSGRELYGAPEGSKVPPVTVAPGATNAVLSNLDFGDKALTFPASPLVTRKNRFQSLYQGTVVTVNGAALEDNLFLDIRGKFAINTSSGGYLRNNRFIRATSHNIYPSLSMTGDAGRNSYNNVFASFNFLMPLGDAALISKQKDVTFVGFDIEAANSGTITSNPAFRINDSGTLRIFIANGGSDPANHSVYRGNYDFGADEVQWYHNRFHPDDLSYGSTDIYLRSSVARFFSVEDALAAYENWSDASPSSFRSRAFDSGNQIVNVNGTNYTGALPTTAQNIIRAILNPTRTGQPWEAPVHGPVPDPAGPAWNAGLAGKPDSTAYIQSLIDTQGIARLPAGIYYISQPLKLKDKQGIIGAGAGTTAIIAKTNINMIVANDPPGGPTSSGQMLYLADITFQGGKTGLFLDPIGTGTGTIPGGRSVGYSFMYVSNVTFRNMSEAGLRFDRIMAVDNVFFNFVNFVNCAKGIDQISGANPADARHCMLIDKCAFYKCQFIGNGIALNLPGIRGNNLNAWINCLFKDNTGGVFYGTANVSCYFMNSDFINNGGNPVIWNDRDISFIGCRFKAGTNGTNHAMMFGSLNMEGCSFLSDGATNAKIVAANTPRAYFANNTSSGMSVGVTSALSGMFLNNNFASDASLNQPMVFLNAGVASTMVTGTCQPGTKLLFGSAFTEWPVNY